MCDGGAPFNVCYRGAVTRMTRSQVSRTGEGKQMKPQLNCSDVKRLPRGPPRQTGPSSGAPLRCHLGAEQLLPLDLSSGVLRSDSFSLAPPGAKADRSQAPPSVVVSDENRSVSQSFINNCLFQHCRQLY